jgi:hypothetical protein
MKLVKEFLYENLSNISIIYAKSPSDYRIKEIEKIAAEFFGTEEDEDQIPSNDKVVKHLFKIGGINSLAINKDTSELIGWGAAIPTSQKLMHKFLDSEITEAQMFWQSDGQHYDAIYFISIFIKPEYRKMGLGLKLIFKTINPLYKENTIVFYDAFSKEGENIFRYLKQLGKYKVIGKDK